MSRRLIVGLGNPGQEYHRSRHNLGFMVVDEIAAWYRIPISAARCGALIGEGLQENYEVILVKPLSFMNRIGIPVACLIDYYGISPSDMLVVHDDMDLELGRLQIKEKGGSGGHKGVQSIIDALQEDRFIRIRLGIGHPEPHSGVTDFVLEPFSVTETATARNLITLARDAITTVLCKGTKEGMNLFHRKSLTISRQTTDGGK